MADEEIPPTKRCRKYASHKEKLRVYRERDREGHNRKRSEWRSANLEKARASARKWAQNNKEKMRLCGRTKEQDRERAKLRRMLNPEAIRKIARRSWKKNIEANRARRKANTARRRAAPGCFTKEDVISIRAAQKGKCAICRVSLGRSYHVDHIVPIAKGGTHNRRNLQLLCAPCNIAKGAKVPEEFMRTRGYLL